jgi:hypothetical protein
MKNITFLAFIALTISMAINGIFLLQIAKKSSYENELINLKGLSIEKAEVIFGKPITITTIPVYFEGDSTSENELKKELDNIKSRYRYEDFSLEFNFSGKLSRINFRIE